MSNNSIFKKLYRRGGVSFQDNTERTVGSAGITFNWDFDRPGYFSLDFLCKIPMLASGNLPKKYFIIRVDGVKRFEVRGQWAWSRTYVFMDEGPHTVTFETDGMSSGDVIKIRKIVHRYFNLVDYDKIEATSLPKPTETVNAYPIINGWQRYQRSGRKGCTLEFTMLFETVTKWRNFMKSFEQVYVLQGQDGTYGGVITPQDVDYVRKGQIILMKCTLNSPSTAGIGVDGM